MKKLIVDASTLHDLDELAIRKRGNSVKNLNRSIKVEDYHKSEEFENERK